jgi:3-deoxy-D-manno-octulosonic-acid transferase
VRAAYATVTTIVRAAAHLAPHEGGKLARSLRARVGLVTRVQAQARAVRIPSRPLVWVHAPSVGEGLQARPVIQALRDAHPDWQVAYTFFSPSAERFAQSIGAHICDYLPFDRSTDADALLDALQPSVLVFSKLDVWPILVERAAARNIPVALISATLAERSGRRGWWSQQLLRSAYRSLNRVGAIDAPNATRLEGLGVRPDAVTLTGDTRFDQVWARAEHLDRSSPLLTALASTTPTLVAGSTWPADEAVLLAAWGTRADVAGNTDGERASHARRLIIAPHEPTAAHLTPIEGWASASGWRLQRLSRIEAEPSLANDADVILVDRVGVLGDLYALADVAFIGGGFHSAGLHSAIEAAAFGVPVLFGPQHHMSREAGLLLSASAAYSVHDVAELRQRLDALMHDGDARGRAGEAARAVVERERGATMKSVALIEALVRGETRR